MSSESAVLLSSTSILGYSFEDYAEMARQFHGSEAPGVLIGGFMVALAVKNLPEGILYNAISETRSCLPDAIQLLTPCTIGNGWLKIADTGRYAITLYDKEDNCLKGVRIFLDTQKVRAWSEINSWFFKLQSKKEQDRANITRQIKEAGESIFGLQRVSIQPQFNIKKNKGEIAVCPQCHEAYPAMNGRICLACQVNTIFVLEPKRLFCEKSRLS